MSGVPPTLSRRRRSNPIVWDAVQRPASRFIVFEGIDGVGKSTQVRQLRDRLRRRGYSVVQTCEPTKGPWGKKAIERGKVEGRLIYFLRDRQEHIAKVIRPGLEAGRIIVCDRYWPSTLAYQTSAGLSPEAVSAALGLVERAPEPDVIVWLRMDPREALARISARAAAGDKPKMDEYERLDLLKRVDIAYARIAGSLLGKMVEVDACGGVLEVAQRVLKAVDLLVPSRTGGRHKRG